VVSTEETTDKQIIFDNNVSLYQFLAEIKRTIQRK